MCPTSDSESLITRCTTLAELISSPTQQEEGDGEEAPRKSTPSNIFWTIAA